jgi:hypothetical protein
VATILDQWPVPDGYDVRVRMSDGRVVIWHSASGEPVGLQAWVDQQENAIRLQEIAAARREEAGA